MYYDKKTGEIKVKEKKQEKKRKMIKSFDELENEKARLMKEVGLNNEAYPLDENQPIDKTANSISKMMQTFNNEYDIDP